MDISRVEKETIRIVKEAKKTGKSDIEVRKEIESLIRQYVEEGA